MDDHPMSVGPRRAFEQRILRQRERAQVSGALGDERGELRLPDLRLAAFALKCLLHVANLFGRERVWTLQRGERLHPFGQRRASGHDDESVFCERPRALLDGDETSAATLPTYAL